MLTAVFDWWRRLSRAEVVAAPFPDGFRDHILSRVPCAELLTEAELLKLETLVRIFNSEKAFEAAGGLELTEEMRVAIAARACLLVLWRVELDEPLYPGLDVIIVYPSTFKAKVQRRDGFVVVEGEEARLGESWTHGSVVLSWDAVAAGAANPRDGHDVVLHEFAHQLDDADGAMDGTPELDGYERYSAWSHIAGDEYAELVEQVERHKKTIAKGISELVLSLSGNEASLSAEARARAETALSMLTLKYGYTAESARDLVGALATLRYRT